MRRKDLWTKTLTAVLAAAMVTSVSPAVPAFAVTGNQVAADGTYTSTKHVARTQDDDEAENEWDEYDVKVDLTVKDGKISDIVATPMNGYNETDNKSYFEKAYSKTKGIKTKLVGQDATEGTINNWDTVTQATRTSKALKEAALEAIQSASEAGAISTTSLEDAIKAAEAKKEADYTADSWKAMQDALTKAKEALDKKESQDAVDSATKALNDAVDALKEASEYSYVYAGMTWSEYWQNEDVQNAGSTASSDTKDSHGEYDKGAFDAVTRATTNHGLHRGSFQCNAVIEMKDGTSYNLAYWKDQTTFVTTEGQEVAIGDIKANINDYKVTGLKYVPVKVKTSDLDALKAKYTVVENGGTLKGGYGEGKLSSYEVTAEVTENTNGLKEATKKEDGSFEFSARKNDGTDSGLKDVSLKKADVTPSVRKTTDESKNTGAYGDFLRVDLDGNYGDLGANMQAVEWTYYGSDSSRTTPVATYGTKFASDNWMHKSMGIQLGLTESERCQLPAGTDGTGYWKLTVYALGYEDYTYEFEVGADNLASEEKEASAEDIAALQAKVDEADKLKEADYTAESWANLKTELDESKELLAKDKKLEAEVKEQVTHLTEAIEKLEKAASEYSYVYVGMTWSEYWQNEDVQNAGSTASSDTKDSHGEYDKGAFDAVTRATTNHGLHRGSFQCNAVIEMKDGTSYNLAYWKDQTTFVTTEGQEVAIGDIKANINDYKVTGLKYVPVKVKTSDLDALKAKYTVVENGGTLKGGYGEGKLSSYEVTAEVTENTNGLKEATKKEDGSFEFSARKNDGTDSGLKDVSLKKADVTPSVRKTTDESKNTGAYGDFLRVDLDGNYGDLGANMQAVEWTYYGSDSSRTTPVATYGTKFASDNWMHKSMGIQLGLTESERCQLPAGTDGTGYWKLTVYALGYEDYTYEFEVGADNLASEEKEASAEDIAALQAKVDEADKLKEADYTAESWANLQTELQESKDLLAKDKPLEAEVKEQTTHLTEAIENLKKADVDTSKLEESVKKADTLKESDYTAESWAAFQSAYAKAKAALEAKDSVTAVKEAQAELDQAIAALSQKAADKAALNDTVQAIENEGYKESDYTKDSWKALQDALKTAKEVMEKDSPLQSEVDAANDALAKAVEGLEVPNTASIDKAIKDAEALKESDYTADSWKALQTALQNAKTALEEKKSQAALDDAANKLNEAIRGLKKKSASSTATSSTSKGNTTGSGTAASGNKGVKTGDTANVLGLLGAAVASLGAAGTSLRFRRKNKKK